MTSLGHNELVQETSLSNAFSWMKIWISLNISLKFVPEGQIKNIPALVQIMAWRRLGDKPLSEPMTVDSKFTDAYMRHSASMS